MGSLTIRTLAERGVRVLGFDRFAPPHAMGSSHGETRIIREAYFEDPRYVPLVQRAYERWADLEQQTGARLFQQTGGLMLGYPDGALISGARLSAELHRLPHDLLDAAAVRRRFPAFRPEDDMVGVWEPRAGMLFPERCIAAALSVAQAAGATVHTGETLLGFDATDAGVTVRTDAGHYEARTLVLSVGAWTRDVLADLALPLVVQRNLLFWFDPERAPAQFAPEAFPIFIADYTHEKAWYGFPDVGTGLKLSRHHYGDHVHPDTVERTVAPEEVDSFREILARYMPDANGTLRAAQACLYTNAPDEHFLIGRHPGAPRVVVASPCSGHGFKFASVIGDVLADLATDQDPAFDLSTFAIDRFGR